MKTIALMTIFALASFALAGDPSAFYDLPAITNLQVRTGVLESGTQATNSRVATIRCGTGIEHLAVKQVTITFTSNKVDLADGGDVGGSTNLLTFPEGRILIIGAAIDATVITTNAWNPSAADTFVVAVGSVAAAADNALTSTEADILASLTCDTASGGTLTFAWEADMTAGADSVFDGTATAVSLFLNVATDDDNTAAAVSVWFTGVFNVFYVWLGDD